MGMSNKWKEANYAREEKWNYYIWKSRGQIRGKSKEWNSMVDTGTNGRTI